MDIHVNMNVAFATAGFMLRKGRNARRNAAGKGFALLAEARAVEHFAGTLLDDGGEDLALHDAIAPSKMKRPGFGKGITTARIAVVEAIGAQRAMEYGEDAGQANRRLNLARCAFAMTEGIAERAMIMAAVIGTARPPACRL